MQAYDNTSSKQMARALFIEEVYRCKRVRGSIDRVRGTSGAKELPVRYDLNIDKDLSRGLGVTGRHFLRFAAGMLFAAFPVRTRF